MLYNHSTSNRIKKPKIVKKKTSQGHNTVWLSFADITMKVALVIVNVFIKAVQKIKTRRR
jgi:hypothetical protein